MGSSDGRGERGSTERGVDLVDGLVCKTGVCRQGQSNAIDESWLEKCISTIYMQALDDISSACDFLLVFVYSHGSF